MVPLKEKEKKFGERMVNTKYCSFFFLTDIVGLRSE
jgi:hypothetical protein